MRVITDDVWAALTIWQEARGEAFEGKVAVGRVIRNRAKDWKRDIPHIVLAPFQFSGWNTNDNNRLSCAVLDDHDPAWLDSVRAWEVSAMSDAGVGDAIFYYNPDGVKSPPPWAEPSKLTAIIGHHHFFTA